MLLIDLIKQNWSLKTKHLIKLSKNPITNSITENNWLIKS